MVESRKLPVKLYFRIGEVADIVGVEPHVLRYWETEFRTIRPQKSSKGQRIYSRRDVEKLIRVKDLLYAQGFTIAGARKRLREGDATDGEVDEAAPRMKAALTQLRFEVRAWIDELGGPAVSETRTAPSAKIDSSRGASRADRFSDSLADARDFEVMKAPD